MCKIENSLYGEIDFPVDTYCFDSKHLLVAGWAFHESGNDVSVEILIDKKSQTIAKWGLPRKDILDKYCTEESYISGFFATCLIKKLEYGSHRLQVLVKYEEQCKCIFQGSFIKSNDVASNPPGFEFYSSMIDHTIPAGASVGSVRSSATNFLKIIKKDGKLKKNNSVLEIGCGFGRFALPVAQFLNKEGNMVAADILPYTVHYLSENVAKRYSNFKAVLLNINNDLYFDNHDDDIGKLPFDDNSFDLIYLQSVFTHVRPNLVKFYLNEFNRILKPGGRSLITYFILDKKSREAIQNGTTANNYKFKHEGEEFYYESLALPEISIAYDISKLKEFYKNAGLDIIHNSFSQSYMRGRWQGNSKAIISQDCIIAKSTTG